MASTTTGKTDAKIVVNAYGQSAGGIWPHFRLLIDGVEVGQATVNASSPTAYSFTVPVTAAQAHKVQIQYDNDAMVNGQDRSLIVSGVTINGKTHKPTDANVTYDKGALDGKDVVKGQSGMWWNGTLVVDTPASDFPAPAAPVAGTSSTFVVNAQGIAAGGTNAHFNLLVDGKKVGEGTVGTAAKDYSFTANVAPDQAHKVQIQYDNDAVVNGQDRSLIVNKVTINGKSVAATDSIVTYDKGALDGKDVVKGQSGLWWNGTLVVDADKSFFATGGSTPTPAPNPTPTPSPAPTGPAFFVATNGNDKWSGKLAAPNANGTDGPKATLTAARDAMRADPNIDVTYVRGGDYTMKDMLWLDGQDSGVRFAAYGSEKPVFHGGSLVDNWVSRGNGLYSAQLPGGSKGVLDLSMDGDRQTVARTPNADPSHPIDGGWLIATKAGANAYTQFGFKAGAIPTYSSTDGLMVSVFTQHGYDNMTVPVKSIDYGSNTITLAQSTYDALGAGSRFYLFNGKDQLDAPREWFFDKASNQVLFKPEGGAVAGHKVVAAQLPVLIGLGGAKNVTIEGLTLTDGAPDGHAVYANNAAGLTFKNNTVTNTGYGITVEGSANSTVTGNHFAETGREAVYVKAGSNFTKVSDNLIQHASAVDHGGDALWVNGSNDVSITHNQIEDTPGKAIAVGSVQASGDATYRATITHNKIVGANQETSDGGGIYLINRQQDLAGHTVAYNEVSGTTAFGNVTWDGKVSPTFLDPTKLVSWGIYLDDWTSGTTVKGNVVHDNVGGIFLHGGWNNTVTDNILADNLGTQIGLQQSVGWGGWKGTPMANNTITQNIVDAGDGRAVALDGPKTAGTFTGNFYAALDPNEALFQAWPQVMANGATGTLAQWQAAGYDKGSFTFDPQFTDAAHDNFAPAAGSAVYQHGFDHLPFDQIGLLG
ncbi:parallel beta-helix repeat protein [Azospirillum sp. OGB3]|uniref:carbohydrate-binding domain-containing protein n=1 Tax=Azospirillum sp. OGB3 TaxID=2587012 RepID=UPI001605FFF9|nr:carbohydrate-binding domain-containing protein [Azospirillum sp. OGB3]MBB3267268.1 parallel beta-helix repeat protein [Azospirillum sp. OGB3]